MGKKKYGLNGSGITEIKMARPMTPMERAAMYRANPIKLPKVVLRKMVWGRRARQ